jgi:methylated-DNA-[protein]-cysteine S-methyltransferase
MELLYDTLQSPVGTILLVSRGEALCALDFSDYEARMRTLLGRRFGEFAVKRAADPNGFTHRLRRYFDGSPEALDGIDVDPGGTEFQRSVWLALRRIPLGETMSYGGLAALIGKPNGARAAGRANSLNPVAIVLPCHRVVGSGGDLTGYAGGLHRKQWLLDHERAMAAVKGAGTLLAAAS